MPVKNPFLYSVVVLGAVVSGVLIYRRRQQIKQMAKKWMMPVIAKISSPFGYRTNPLTQQVQFHNGVDLRVPVGTKIKSPMDGVVEHVYSNTEGGNQLIIKHNNGYQSGYAHLTRAIVKKGDKLKKGDLIALSGNTGKSTGPHLHFTLKDPLGKWLDAQKLIVT